MHGFRLKDLKSVKQGLRRITALLTIFCFVWTTQFGITYINVVSHTRCSYKSKPQKKIVEAVKMMDGVAPRAAGVISIPVLHMGAVMTFAMWNCAMTV